MVASRPRSACNAASFFSRTGLSTKAWAYGKTSVASASATAAPAHFHTAGRAGLASNPPPLCWRIKGEAARFPPVDLISPATAEDGPGAVGGSRLSQATAPPRRPASIGASRGSRALFPVKYNFPPGTPALQRLRQRRQRRFRGALQQSARLRAKTRARLSPASI